MFDTEPNTNENYIWEPPTKGVTTEAMGLVNSGSLVSRIFEGASPFAFLREFVQNALDAGATKVEVGPDWTGISLAMENNEEPTYKLMFSDNGHGIPRDKMKKLLNNLSSSGRNMTKDGNFGIGAKVAALPFNPYGIVFQSWTSDSSGMVRLFKRTDSNYGLFRWNESTENHNEYKDLIEPPDDYRHTYQQTSGTNVILLGNNEHEDTIFGPPDEQAGLQAIIRIINDRYFAFDDGVKVSVCVFDNATKAKWPKTKRDARYQTVKGTKAFLDSCSEDSGTIRSNNYGVKLHWWYHPNKTTSAGYVSDAGFVGTLYNNELYDTVRKSSKSQLALQSLFARFGLFYQEVWENVTIIAEPDRASEKNPDGVAPDLSRGKLRYKSGETLPWDDWGKVFVDNMPKVIFDAITKASEGSVSTIDLEDKIKEYLDRMDLYTEQKSGGSGNHGNGSFSKRRRSRNTDPAEKGNTPTKYHLPNRKWVKPSDLGEDDLFQGKAVHYQEKLNELLFNEEFPLWKRMVDYWVAKYPSTHVRGKVKEAVRLAYEMAVCTRIVHIRKFRNKAEWTTDSVEKALSNEALTLVTLGIQDADMHISNYLKGTVRMVRIDSVKNKTSTRNKQDASA